MAFPANTGEIILSAPIERHTAYASHPLVHGCDKAPFTTHPVSSSRSRCLALAPPGWHRSEGRAEACAAARRAHDLPSTPAGAQWRSTWGTD